MPAWLAVASAGVALAQAADLPSGVSVRPYRPSEGEGLLRLFAREGDLLLSNSEVSAVVRRRDGWLVDFWRERPRLPTAEQLGTITHIDALWQVFPVVRLGNETIPLVTDQVQVVGGAVETRAVLQAQGLTVAARTTYRIPAVGSKLLITTDWDVRGPSDLRVALGDSLRWGNVAYVVDGHVPAQARYRGAASWIGRHGAGGDLLLRALSPARFQVEYESSAVGFAGAIHAYQYSGRAPVRWQVQRELSFESLPQRSQPERAPTATLDLTVTDERGAPLAAKIKLRRHGSDAPLFDPDGHLDGAHVFAWTGNGQLSRELPPGRYELLVTSGIERAASQHDVTLTPGQRATMAARLPRVLATPGWIAADLHLHQAPSVDADIDLPARVISVAAEGVEFAVATDHYVVTDLGPTVRWLRESGALTVDLQTMPGSEVSTLGHRFGHFNVFPLQPTSRVVYEDTTAERLFADARRQSPRGIVQVNHPRWDAKVGYFTSFDLDPVTGLPRRPGYSRHFDTLEVYNGLDAIDLDRVRAVMRDWLHLLARGERHAATGSSDSHKLAFLDPGVPRTLVRHGGEQTDERDVFAEPQSVLEAIRAGRSLVTSGPVLDVTLNGRGPGETVSLAGASEQALRVVVRAAPWIDVRHVEVLEGPSRVLERRNVARSQAPSRLDLTLPLRLRAPTFIVVVAWGDDPLPNAAQPIRPFAFTNPIWIEP